MLMVGLCHIGVKLREKHASVGSNYSNTPGLHSLESGRLPFVSPCDYEPGGSD